MLNFLAALTYWHWFGFAIFLLIIELLVTSTGFLLWIAIAAAVVGLFLVIVPGITWSYQLLIFVMVALLYSAVGKRLVSRQLVSADKPVLNKRAAQYIGRVFLLQTAIENGRGTIHVDDTIWRVSGPDLPIGTPVKVVRAEGVILQVKPELVS
jgi:membrane protein implicated in regulation of membrane protease activity